MEEWRVTRATLWGREAELARLGALLDQLPERGGSLILRGEAGIGKSVLLESVSVEASRRGWRVLTATGVQAEVHVPFLGLQTLFRRVGWTEILAAVDEEVATADDQETQPFRVALGVLRLLTAHSADGPIVLVVEDAQWLDRPTWEVLAFVGRRLDADAVLLLMAMRDGEAAEVRLARAAMAELRIDPLGVPDAVELLADRAPGLSPALRQRVLAEAAGNPLGLVELASVAARYGPTALLPAWLPLTTRLEQTFAVALGELTELTRAVLVVAALDDGDDVDEILAASSLVRGEAVTVDDLRPAALAGLIEFGEMSRLRFRHPLVRSSLRQRASPSQRRLAHAALAETLAGDEDRRVWHRAEAATHPDEQLALDLAAAAVRARRRGAVASALAALDRSARLTSDDRERSRRLLVAAEAATEVGDIGAVQRLLSDVDEQLLPQAGMARLAWVREVYLGSGWTGAARIVSYVDILERMRLAGDHEQALDSLVLISLRCFWSNPDAPTRAAVIAAAERLDVSPLDPRLVVVLGLVAPVERGAVVLERMSQLLPRFDMSASQLEMVGTAGSAVGALAASMVFHAAAVAGLRYGGRLGTLAQALVGQAWTAAQLGDTRLGLTAATEGAALAAETGQPSWVLTANLVLAHVHALRGEGEVARGLADAGEGVLIPMGAYPILALVQVTRGVDALAGGRFAEAYEQLYRIFDDSDLAYHPYLRFSTFVHLVEAGAGSGHDDELRELARSFESVVRQTGSPILRIGLRYAEALLADDGEAEALFRAGLGGDLASWPFERARLQHAFGGWLRRQRRPAECRTLLRTAAATFDALGAQPWAERARGELRASGETRRGHDRQADSLTPQEMQITQLAAEGLSNREIATRLFLSPRTVGTHLYRIYPKLGVSSRAELGRLMPPADSPREAG